MNHITLVSQTPGIVRVDSTQLLLPWQKQGQYGKNYRNTLLGDNEICTLD